MGIIRLVLITAALIWLMMYYFGRDDGLPEDRLGRAPAPPELAQTPAPEVAETPEPGAAVPKPEPITPPEPAAVAQPVADPVAPTPEPTPEPEPLPESEPDVVLYVAGRTVNVRSGPSTTFAAITSLTRGTAVVDLGDAGEGWRQIRLDSGEIGYMSGDFLSPDPL